MRWRQIDIDPPPRYIRILGAIIKPAFGVQSHIWMVADTCLTDCVETGEDYWGEDWDMCSHEPPTHWMPLPTEIKTYKND